VVHQFPVGPPPLPTLEENMRITRTDFLWVRYPSCHQASVTNHWVEMRTSVHFGRKVSICITLYDAKVQCNLNCVESTLNLNCNQLICSY